MAHPERLSVTRAFVRHRVRVGRTPTRVRAISRLPSIFILRHSARMSDYRFFDRLRADAAAERRAIIAGLLASAPAIAPKHFYDPVGSALFGAICELPEYYPTRTERAIFAEHREEIAEAIGTGRQFVDLGAGDCRKAQGWLPFLAPTRYIAVDIAGDALARA